MSDRHRPVFVYGTLRPGQGNYRHLLANRAIDDRPAQVSGYALYGSAFPYAVREPGTLIHGAVLWIDPANYTNTLLDLDHLEGYRPTRPTQSHYVRVEVTATSTTSLVGGGSVHETHNVWMYEAGPRFRRGGHPRIESGDWVAERLRAPASTSPQG